MEQAVGQQRRLLPWKQTLGPELSLCRAETVLRKWQVRPYLECFLFSHQQSCCWQSYLACYECRSRPWAQS